MHGAVRKLISIRLLVLSLIEVALVAASFAVATFAVFPVDALLYLQYEGAAPRIALLCLTYLVVSYLFDFYKQLRVSSRLGLAEQLAQLTGITLLVQAAFGFIQPELVLPQPIVILGTAIMLAILLAWRIYVRPMVWNAFGAQRVIFVGANSAVQQLAAAFRTHASMGMHVVGYIVRQEESAPVSGPFLGTYADLVRTVAQTKPDRIIVGTDSFGDKTLLQALFQLKSSGLAVETAGYAYEAVFGRIYSRGLEPYTVIFRDDLAARPGSVALQSIYTNILALAGLVITLPLILLIALFMKITRGGAALLKIPCIGLHGIPFNMYRFRCTPTQGDFASRFLLRYKLEGLPQALNIVRGEMALIGPRAERVEYDRVLTDLFPFYRYRQHVKPGIMGWSQLHCDNKPYEDTLARIEHDLYYVKHISLVLDAYILMRALKWIISDRHAADAELATVSSAT